MLRGMVCFRCVLLCSNTHLKLEKQPLQRITDGICESHVTGIGVPIDGVCVEGPVEASNEPGRYRAVDRVQVLQDPGKLLRAGRKVMLRGKLQKVDRAMVKAVPVTQHSKYDKLWLAIRKAAFGRMRAVQPLLEWCPNNYKMHSCQHKSFSSTTYCEDLHTWCI